jgi:hypothetical protein
LVLGLFGSTFGLHRIPLKQLNKKPQSIFEHVSHLHRKYNITMDLPKSIMQLDAGQTVPLTNYLDVQYYGSIQLGTGNAKKCFTALFDTGSSDTWVPGPTCTGPSCSGAQKYDCSTSSTCQDKYRTVEVGYGKGHMKGELVTDKLCFGCGDDSPYCIGNQDFVTTTSETDFDGSKSDGLVGMGYTALAESGSPTPFSNLMASGDCPQKVFAFWLNQNQDDGKGGEMTLCGTDPSHYVGQITYTPVTEPKYWKFSIQNVKIGSYSVTSGIDAIADTGTSFLAGPQSQVQNIYNQLNKKYGVYVGQSGLMQVSCSKRLQLPNLTLQISGRTFTVTPASYVLQDPSGICVLGFLPLLSNDMWILGDVFLGPYYTIFDQGNNQLGFAQSTPPVKGGSAMQVGSMFLSVVMSFVLMIARI